MKTSAALGRYLAIPFLLFFIFASTNTAGQSRPPTIFVDRNICPGEGCQFKGHRAKIVATTTAYKGPSTTSGRLFTVPLGLMVTGIDSLVRTRPGQFRVKRPMNRPNEKYRPGEVLFVYTYLGEGVFKIWYRGKMIEENLEFSVWGGSAGERCELDPVNCWGILEKRTDMKWWLKVRLNDGRRGWILVDKNLDWFEG